MLVIDGEVGAPGVAVATGGFGKTKLNGLAMLGRRLPLRLIGREVNRPACEVKGDVLGRHGAGLGLGAGCSTGSATGSAGWATGSVTGSGVLRDSLTGSAGGSAAGSGFFRGARLGLALGMATSVTGSTYI